MPAICLYSREVSERTLLSVMCLRMEQRCGIKEENVDTDCFCRRDGKREINLKICGVNKENGN